jgi:hypothetical protein
MNEHCNYEAKDYSATMKFMWRCAGADERILKYSSYSDQVKYFCIGGIVLSTGFMAFLSMGFAIHTIFQNWYVTLAVALAWSLIVFNIDRFIVSSTGKGIDGADESRMSWEEWKNAIPRLIMAIILGITISAPLETKIFSVEISREWEDTKKELALKRINEEKYKFRISGELDQVNQKLDSASKNLVKYEEVLLLKDKMIENLQTGANGERCVKGANCTQHRDLYKQRDEAKINVDKTKTEIDNYKKNIETTENEHSLSLKTEGIAIMDDTAGFLDQIMMLEKLSSEGKKIPEYDPLTSKPDPSKEPKEVYGSAFWPIWLVRCLFMIIEILPVLLKMMLIKSPYDYMSENINQILEAKQGINQEHMKVGEEKILKYKKNFHPVRITHIIEHQNNAEEENSKYAIDKFAKLEKDRIDEDPESFIKPDDPNSKPNNNNETEKNTEDDSDNKSDRDNGSQTTEGKL